MDISGRMFREVEFRDRLRGYDTDEVDEFLEKAAVGVDELHAEIARLNELVKGAQEVPLLDDDAIRRTLMLAQRTADLAVKEAQSEADRLLADARARAEALVQDAEQSAQRQREHADAEFAAMIVRLTTERDDLETHVQHLRELVEHERARLSERLGALLGEVSASLMLSNELSETMPPQPVTSAGVSSTEAGASHAPDRAEDPFEIGLPNIEDELGGEDLATFSNARIAGAPAQAEEDDDELWERWATSGGELGEPGQEDFHFGDDDKRR